MNILIIDDDNRVCLYVSYILKVIYKDYKDFNIQTVNDCEGSLEIILNTSNPPLDAPVDLIITDYHLLRDTATTCLGRLYDLGYKGKVIIMTGDKTKDRESLGNLRFEGILYKPFDAKGIDKILKEVGCLE